MKKLILASKSKRRIKILNSLKVRFIAEKNNIPELPKKHGLDPKNMVMINALNKAVYSSKKHKKGIIIAADTIIYKNGRIFGKPKSKKDAMRILNSLKGKPHYVYTGIAVINLYAKSSILDYEKSKVYFRNFSQKELNKYIHLENTLDKAGAYNLDGLGSILCDKIEGCFFNIVGLPIAKLEKMLNKLNLTIFDFISQK